MLAFVFSALVVLLDQFFKRWIVRTIELHETVELIPGIIGLTHIHNTGAAFSILAGQRWLLAGIAFAACLVLVFVLLRYTEGFWGTIGLAAVLGGAVGNLVDRVLYGYVIDMFRTLFINFAIFNVADIFITLGFITFCVHFIKVSIKQAREEKEESEKAKAGMDDGYYDYDDEYGDEEGYYEEEDYEKAFNEEHSQYNMPDNQQGLAPNMGTDPDLSDLKHHVESALGEQTYPNAISSEPIVTQEIKDPNSWHEYYESAAQTNSEALTSTLDSLSALEQELGFDSDYDVDALLKEYGFEDSGEEK